MDEIHGTRLKISYLILNGSKIQLIIDELKRFSGTSSEKVICFLSEKATDISSDS